jgi:hypothetical protein
MDKSSTPEVLLRVFDANKQDYGRGIVRILVHIMKRLAWDPAITSRLWEGRPHMPKSDQPILRIKIRT